ncbi:hypothetical protein GA0061078_1367 [Bifidobacterium bohemicum]|uniref:Uncharacterized protein n=1 Tax=Bifidobacterium bohemicum DSM 22767 TaxID=1437606 RepID=A0A086ZGQ7_9BIFI|nr:hypothetical protein [Bifidobacterium bohemicum]KFI45707.1 hypothetical protein BBOH_0508 [Bifidobacterium bohemicum DSM 22767]SCC07583.1 hypothetical protein GA0061078_1367 [Bifidobacterium bohemicum]
MSDRSDIEDVMPPQSDSVSVDAALPVADANDAAMMDRTAAAERAAATADTNVGETDEGAQAASGDSVGSAPRVESQVHVVPQMRPSSPNGMRPGGPSVGTLVLSLFLLFFAVVVLIVGMGTPISPGNFAFGLDIRAFVALVVASFGVLLILVAVVWAIVSAVRRRRTAGR